MEFGRFDRFVLNFAEYSGCVVVEEPHTKLRVEASTRDEARSLMVKALTEWTADRPDPEAPVYSQETVMIDRRPPGFFEPPF